MAIGIEFRIGIPDLLFEIWGAKKVTNSYKRLHILFVEAGGVPGKRPMDVGDARDYGNLTGGILKMESN